MLPPLLRKAIGDAGYDLALGADAEWTRVGVSGLPHAVAWVVPVHAGALLALAEPRVLAEFTTAGWTDVPLPATARGATRCHTPAELYDAMRRARVLFAQLPPLPEEKLAQRLAALAETERTALVKQRVGQDLFRELLLDYWDGRCAVTGLAVPALLRASHAKPWAASDDRERLDVHNGFLLAVHLDALFDGGLMTFDADGSALFSPRLDPEQMRLLVGGDVGSLRLRQVAEGHERYLEYHRRWVFGPGPR